MNYKEKLYTKYVSGYKSRYEGEVTLNTLKSRAILWRKLFGKFLPADKNAEIIDLGCGPGTIVWWLQRSGYKNAQGIDISAEQLESGRRLGVTNIEQGDIQEFLQDKKGRFDVIFARDIIEHFSKKEVFEILSLCFQSLKDNGRMIIQVPNAESPFGGRNRYGDFTHEVAFTAVSMSQLLHVVGFDNVRVFPQEPTLWPDPMSIIRFVLWQFVKAFYKFLLYVELGELSRVSIVSLNIIVVATKKIPDNTRDEKPI